MHPFSSESASCYKYPLPYSLFAKRFDMMSPQQPILVLLLSVIPCAYAYQGLVNGATLKAELEGAFRYSSGHTRAGDAPLAAHAYGDVGGIVDAMNNETAGRFFCVPSKVMPAQPGAAVLDHMNKNSQAFSLLAGNSASLTVFEALGQKFPCKRQGSR